MPHRDDGQDCTPLLRCLPWRALSSEITQDRNGRSVAGRRIHSTLLELALRVQMDAPEMTLDAHNNLHHRHAAEHQPFYSGGKSLVRPIRVCRGTSIQLRASGMLDEPDGRLPPLHLLPCISSSSFLFEIYYHHFQCKHKQDVEISQLQPRQRRWSDGSRPTLADASWDIYLELLVRVRPLLLALRPSQPTHSSRE